MQQSIVLKQPLQEPTSGQINRNVISLEKYLRHLEIQKRIHDGKMLKQKLIGISLLIMSILLWFLPTCRTAAVFVGLISFMMIDNKNNNKGDNKNVHSK